MNVTGKHSTPLGVYLLSALFLLFATGMLYYTITVPSYLFIAIVTIPLFIYMGIGLIKQWPRVKQTIIIVAILLFAGALVDITTVLFLEGTDKIFNFTDVLGIVVRLTLFPAVQLYFRQEEVRSYFEPAT